MCPTPSLPGFVLSADQCPILGSEPFAEILLRVAVVMVLKLVWVILTSAIVLRVRCKPLITLCHSLTQRNRFLDNW